MSDFPEPTFSFILDEYGWAKLIIIVDGERHTIDRVSYLTDVLDELLFAGLKLSVGWSESKVHIDHEGWDTDLLFRGEWIERSDDAPQEDGRHADLRCRIETIVSASQKTETLFSYLIRNPDVVARALLRCGQEVWNRYGAEEYDRLWISGGFPIRALGALKAALDVEPFVGHRDRVPD